MRTENKRRKRRKEEVGIEMKEKNVKKGLNLIE